MLTGAFETQVVKIKIFKGSEDFVFRTLAKLSVIGCQIQVALVTAFKEEYKSWCELSASQ